MQGEIRAVGPALDVVRERWPGPLLAYAETGRFLNGLGARQIEGEADVRDVIELLRLNLDRAVTRLGPPAEARA